MDWLFIVWIINNGKKIGSRKPEISVGLINFEELNGKPCREIIAGTYCNMNGNSWKECFVCFPQEDTIKYAGSFCTQYHPVFHNDTVYLTEEYYGSFYMNPHQTLYIWHNDELIPLRTAEMIVSGDYNNDKQILEYYETNDYNQPMKLIFREKYNEHNKKHRKYWDIFF
ncbi:MAG: hypothetical protein FWF72_00920 [Paludibacter sp.]|nr:hypothetical protein [Paludibacter sp.]